MRNLIILLFIPFLSFGQVPDLLQLANWQQANSFDSGLILNGTFDDASNLTVGTQWSIAGGVATCTTTSGFSQLKMTTSTTLTASANYTLTFTISNSGTARFSIRVTQSGADAIIVGNVTYANGTHIVTLTMPAGANSTDIIFENSGAATTFDVDNVSLFAD